MAQTTGATSARNQDVEVSTNGTVWTDISGTATSVESTDQARQSGEAYTFDGDTAIVTSGKLEPIELQVKILYTEGVGEGFEVVRAAHEAGTPLYVRWAPKGATTGNKRYTSDPGVITSFTYPPGVADDPKPIMAGFKIKVPKVTSSAVA